MSYPVPDLHWQYETTGQLKDDSETPSNDQNGSLQEINAQHFEYRTLKVNSGLLRLDSVPAVQQDLGMSRAGDVAARGPQSIDNDQKFRNTFDWSQSPQPAVQSSKKCQMPEQTVPSSLPPANERKRLAVQKSRAKTRRENEQTKNLLKAAVEINKNLKLEVQNLQKKSKQNDRQIEILQNSLQLAGVQATKDADEITVLEGCLRVAADVNDNWRRENDRLTEELARKNNELESLKSNVDQLTDQLVLTEYMLEEYQTTNDPLVGLP